MYPALTKLWLEMAWWVDTSLPKLLKANPVVKQSNTQDWHTSKGLQVSSQASTGAEDSDAS